MGRKQNYIYLLWAHTIIVFMESIFPNIAIIHRAKFTHWTFKASMSYWLDLNFFIQFDWTVWITCLPLTGLITVHVTNCCCRILSRSNRFRNKVKSFFSATVNNKLGICQGEWKRLSRLVNELKLRTRTRWTLSSDDLPTQRQNCVARRASPKRFEPQARHAVRNPREEPNLSAAAPAAFPVTVLTADSSEKSAHFLLCCSHWRWKKREECVCVCVLVCWNWMGWRRELVGVYKEECGGGAL